MIKNNTTTKIETCYGDKAYETIQELQEGVECGDVLAAYYLAQHYEEGTVVSQDYNKAAELYMLVSACRKPLIFADSSMPLTPQCEAEYAVGCFYEKGILPDSTMEKAIDWFRRAIKDAGHDAYFKMAELYLEGRYVKCDYDEAASCLYHGYLNFGHNHPIIFKLASELDGKTSTHQNAIWEILAHCYERGVGVSMDGMKADYYYSKYSHIYTPIPEIAIEQYSNANKNDDKHEVFSF